MQAWCLAAVLLCGVAVCTGTVWLRRAGGVRIVSGRPWAMLTWLWLLAAVGLVSSIACVFARTYPAIWDSPEISRVLAPVLLMAAPILAVAVAWVAWHARSLSRSVIFYNVRRDDLARTVADTLRRMGLPASHRLLTFKDEFCLPDGRIIVHGAIGLSRIESIGGDRQSRKQVIDEIEKSYAL